MNGNEKTMSKRIIRYNIEKIKQECTENNLEFLEVITDTRTKIHCRCKTCGKEILRALDKWNAGSKSCPVCSKQPANYELRRSRFEEILNSAGYSLIGNFKNDSTKVRIKHNECGYEYEVTPNHFKQGRRCPKCNGGVSYSVEEFKEKFYSTHDPNEFELLDSYAPGSSIRIKHLKCGETFTVKDPCRVANLGTGCPFCTGAVKKPLKILKQQVEEIDNGEYQLVSDNENGYIALKHNCGEIFTVNSGNFLNKNWGKCPKCFPSNKSIGELEVLEFIKSLGVSVESGVTKKVNNRNYQIDIFVKDLNVGFEFDGLYWHSAEFRDKNHLVEKLTAMNSIGIRLVNIFEDEWKFKKDIVKDKIKNILGISDNKRIFARKCTMKDISSKDRNSFLEKYHIQGKDTANISKGLFYNDELIAVMSLIKLRKALGSKSEAGVYELSRFACSCNVIGGFSKMLKDILEEFPEIKTIKTYADLRWSDKSKNVYLKNDFKLINISKPNYWYFDPSSLVRYHRFSFRKQELKNKFPEVYQDTLTEIEIMKKTKFKQIYDCGNLVYEYQNNQNN